MSLVSLTVHNSVSIQKLKDTGQNAKLTTKPYLHHLIHHSAAYKLSQYSFATELMFAFTACHSSKP